MCMGRTLTNHVEHGLDIDQSRCSIGKTLTNDVVHG